ncbi:hypothetical protein GGI12_002089 [Dipsacomyces acuminosporus]|nr:hypothetical protein GGI12_002089 [Dipsacomyces acuminosporus]
MMLGSPTTPIIPVSTPRTATSQQQFRYPQDVTAAAAAAAAAVAAAASNSTSPASSVFVSDYTQIIANQMSAQQTAAALIAANTPTAAMAATLGGGVEGSMSSAEMLNLAAGLASVSNPELLAAQTSSPAQQAASLLYTPPLGSVPHRSSAMSSTPSLTECTPSPYSVSYPLYVPPQQAVIPSLPSCVAVVNGNAIPGQAFLAASNQNHPVFASSLAPGGAPATGIDAVLPQTPSAFSQWFS